MSAFKKNMPECSTCNCGSATTTHGIGCSSVCPGGMPITITITPVSPGSELTAYVPTVLNFSATGSGNSTTDNNLSAAGGSPFSAWWSARIPDTATGYFQWCYTCAGSPGKFGYGSLALMHNTSGTGGAFVADRFAYIFDSTNSCNPFLQTGTYQPNEGGQQWVASG